MVDGFLSLFLWYIVFLVVIATMVRSINSRSCRECGEILGGRGLHRCPKWIRKVN